MTRWYLVEAAGEPVEVSAPSSSSPAASSGAPVSTSLLPETTQPAPDPGGQASTTTLPAGEPSALDFLDQVEGKDGIVVNEALARESPCVAYELGARKLVFSKGVIGALDASQQALYCPSTESRPLSPQQQERLAAFRTSAEACHVEVSTLAKGERLSPFLKCMESELRSRGQRL